MADELFERYRDALLLGHRAARRGDVETAVEAYEEAAACAPTRALPWASCGVLLLDHGRAAEAAAAFREAILRDPTDEETIAGLRRAEALLGVAPDAPAVAPAPAVTATSGAAEAPEAAPETDEPVELALAAAAAVDAGDRARALPLALAAARGHLERGRVDAAIDVCLRALAVAPAAPELHLFLVERWLERGWHGLAAEKLELLGRLAALREDGALAERVAALAAELARRDRAPGGGPGPAAG